MRNWKASTADRSARRSSPTSPPPRRRPSAPDLDALTPDRALVARFSADLDALAGTGPLGLAVSGGADSMAMLLLAAAARPRQVEAMTVDHGLRAEAEAEAEAVAGLCARLGVPHTTLALELADGANLQARARAARYAAMAGHAHSRGLAAIATAHHADDQAETLVMRLTRGAGLSGLAGVRPVQSIARTRVVRPLLGWRKAALQDVCRAAGVDWAEDPSNSNLRFDRTAAREALRSLDLDAQMVGRSASHLAEAEDALEWVIAGMAGRLLVDGREATVDVDDLPTEIARRLLLRAFVALDADVPRGPDLERAMANLRDGRNATLSGLLLTASSPARWHVAPAPPRRP